MGPGKYLLLFISLTGIFYDSQGCEIEGVGSWLLTVEDQIYDYYTGTFWNRSVSNIEEITSFISGGSVDSSRYIAAQLAAGYVTLSTSVLYPQYEENETAESMSFTLTFRCTDGTTNLLTFEIGIIDTNNNPPIFLPSDTYEFTITPPVPPGFFITGCDQEIIVRDIDLTTSAIEFTLEENPYVEIVYLDRSPTDSKQFIAGLRTTDLIRNLPGDIELFINATDVDRTGDPPITTVGSIILRAGEEFLFPDEPIFSQPFYLATYSNNQVVLQQSITLQQGYDDEVVFSLDREQFTNPELSNYFNLASNGNEVSIVVNSLPNEVLRTGTIILVVRADREYTSGSAATVIIELPEVPTLEFEQMQYSGAIVDNILEPLQLTLSQGYDEEYTVAVVGAQSSYFTTTNQGSTIFLSMSPLDNAIIEANNFLTLQVVASNQYGSSTTVITLEIIKDDNITPVFEQAIYLGEYIQETGLTVPQIVLAQGYDENVSFSLQGDHSEYFQISNTGATVTVTSSGIPAEIWPEQQIILTLEASKPRSVTVTTIIAISLPSARELAFPESVYSGTLQDNVLSLPAIVLSTGYADDVTFSLEGDYANYFSLLNDENQVTISTTFIPDEIILQNNFLNLIIRATGTHAITTTTTITLEVIKQDLVTPAFSENIYQGYYNTSLEIESISLAQGYDSSVTYRLEGELSQYFSLSSTSNNVNLVLQSAIPPDVIFREKVLIFNILADKPLTVGANAAVSISFPEEFTEPIITQFSQNAYVGSVENNNLSLEDIILETGYDESTVFTLNGEYASLFSFVNSSNVVTILLTNELTEEIIESNDFFILEIEATRERAVTATTTIVIDVVRQEIIHPVFSNAYYRSVYANEVFEEITISLEQGFDDTVTFTLEGENSIWFTLTQTGSSIQLAVNSSTSIPEEVLENNDYLLLSIVAQKPGALTARAAVFIDLPKETQDPEIVRFSQISYVGSINNGELFAPTITLLGEREPVSLLINGTYAEYFEAIQATTTNVQIRLMSSLPESIENLPFIVLDLVAQYPEAISGHTAIVLEIVTPDIPVFEQAFYIGEFSQQGLQFDQSIQLIQGFDESVVFTLAGDDARWFELIEYENNNFTLGVNLELEEITNRSHLTFAIIANKPNSIPGQSAIVINLSGYSTNIPLRFTQDFYLGEIENGNLNISSIILDEGYSPDMEIAFSGDYVAYFQLTHQDGIFTLQQLPLELPAEILDANSVLVFTIEVQVGESRTHTTVILEIIKSEATPLAFEEAYYVGSYSIIGGFTFDPQIALIEGYEETVSFSLEGDDSQWFGLVEDQYPITLIQTNPIPNEIVSSTQQLVFVLLAQNLNNVTARSTIIVTIIDDTTVLEFERNVYLGTIDNNTVDIDAVVLTEGYSNNVIFTLLGDLATYFSVSQDEASVTITLQTEIPDNELPNSGILLLELQASAPQAISAYATLIFGVLRPSIDLLQFSETYYVGSYTVTNGFEFLENATLAQGFDVNVQFVLEGDDSQYFEAVVLENSVSLKLINPIPAEIMMTQQQLIFTIRADKTSTSSAWATIVISLIDDSESENVILQFERISYIGYIEDDIAHLDPIVLHEGYSENVTFTLFGDLASYFNITNVDESVSIALRESIPEQLELVNGIIILELQASASDAISAYAVIVLNLVQEENAVEHPLFSDTYYEGLYTEIEGLSFPTILSLTEGYDENVVFALEGDNSQYFELVTLSENSLSLQLSTTPITSEVFASNQQLIFIINAEKSNALTARATIVISLLPEEVELNVLGFEQRSYVGTIENGTANLEWINLVEGYTQNVNFILTGELADFFNLSTNGSMVTLNLLYQIPEDVLPENNIVILELQASAPQHISAYVTIILRVVQEEVLIADILSFSQVYYIGTYTEIEGLSFEETITLSIGYSDNVQFTLDGEDSQYFEAVSSGNLVSLRLITPIPPGIVSNNNYLIFTIRAQTPQEASGIATIVISLLDEITENSTILGFERITYLGSIENGNTTLEPITLREGYTQDVIFSLHGELATYFTLRTSEATVTINLSSPIPEEILEQNSIIILELQASSPQAISAHTTIIFEVGREDVPVTDVIVFSASYYTGFYTEVDGLAFEETITLIEGYNENVQFALIGDNSQYFEAVGTGNSISLRLVTPIPSAIVSNNDHLIFVIQATATNSVTGRATIVISLRDDLSQNATALGFNRISYIGSIENDVTHIETIILSAENSAQVTFTLYGDLANYFTVTEAESVVTVSLHSSIPEELIPTNRVIILELQASISETISAFATIIFEVISMVDIPILSFSKPYYTGYYSTEIGFVMSDAIIISEGFDETVQLSLEGDHSQWFELQMDGNSINLSVNSSIPEDILNNNRMLILSIVAQNSASSARTVIIISLTNGEVSSDTSFEKVLFLGRIENGVVYHETISVSNYNGSSLEILGDYEELFSTSVAIGVVSVQGSGSLTLPADVSFIALELRADLASAVLVLDVIHSETPSSPSVLFGSPSYILRVGISQTGLVGRVEASADNGEALLYSLTVADNHLLQRLSINDDGELFLSAPVNNGVYSFQVIATTVFSQASGNATVHLTVEAITECGDGDYVLPPLQILDRDEEEPHTLITFDADEFPGCQYTMANRWPADQQWLYVDETGLHTISIDREHESIAFMALSQIQVILTLVCDSDSTRTKRSVDTTTRIEQLEHLGPYDYGNSKWILTDSIFYNPRQTVVNLIVNDINDNYPIFVGVEYQPVTVGWPVADLEERILPRYLAEVKATDADVGANAALVYWSDEEALAVSPSSGLVHVTNNNLLEENSILTVYATDRNGEGLTGSLDLMVKLIDTSHIAVVTVRNAFLDDEENILTDLSAAIGYEVKALRTTVVTDTESEEVNSRMKREAIISTGAFVQLYVYGLIQREPVAVERLTEDIMSIENNIDTVTIASTVSLEDHLENLEICPLSGRDTALFVSTIVLAVLLFILIVAIAVWYFLKRWKKKNYEQFSDANSLASRDDSLNPAPKPENITKPRINIEELKRSERRLQEMLDAPVTEVTVDPTVSKIPEKVPEAKVTISEPPIVIQSIDKLKAVDDSSGDEDEFGERRKAKRKSVVTFNENVEKIIHVEDSPEDDDNYEVYRL